MSVTLTALYYDGRVSRGVPVTVERSADRLIVIWGENVSLELPASAVRPMPRVGSTPRTLHLPEGHLECPDCPELRIWFGHGSRFEAISDWIERRWPAVLASALIVLAGIVLFTQYGLPWTAKVVAHRVPVELQDRLGRETMLLLDKRFLKATNLPVDRQAALRERFDRVKEGLAQASRYQLEFRQGGPLGANAFALPSGTIVMTDELVGLAADDDEVASVLAHEIGHNELRHHLRTALQNSGLFAVAALFTGDVASASSWTVALPTTLIHSAYSRDFEREADDYAVDRLHRVGLPPGAFARMLRKLDEAHPLDGRMAYLSSHPETLERIEAAGRRTAALARP